MAATEPQRRRTAGDKRQAHVELALARLLRFVTLEQEYADQLNEAGQRLLRASTFSAYCDCRALGATRRADAILASARAGDLPASASPTERPAEVLS